jgi:hypothetical protein
MLLSPSISYWFVTHCCCKLRLQLLFKGSCPWFHTHHHLHDNKDTIKFSQALMIQRSKRENSKRDYSSIQAIRWGFFNEEKKKMIFFLRKWSSSLEKSTRGVSSPFIDLVKRHTTELTYVFLLKRHLTYFYSYCCYGYRGLSLWKEMAHKQIL